jgi:hypothetical protein
MKPLKPTRHAHLGRDGLLRKPSQRALSRKLAALKRAIEEYLAPLDEKFYTRKVKR